MRNLFFVAFAACIVAVAANRPISNNIHHGLGVNSEELIESYNQIDYKLDQILSFLDGSATTGIHKPEVTLLPPPGN